MLVDANQCYTRHLALRVGRVLEELDVLLFEEPLPIDDVAGHAFLADKLDVRIATGENMYTRWDFLPYFRSGAIHVVQADASRCGGISEAKRIFDLAGAYHLHAIPHTFSDALTIAANLHVVAASSNAPIIEYDATYNPIQTELVTNPPLPCRQRDRRCRPGRASASTSTGTSSPPTRTRARSASAPARGRCSGSRAR